jgi:cobalamin biosynthesis Mg chelatase CobN
VLTQLLKTSDRIVQEIDSVEYGLTDIQEYYANTGGLKKAAEKVGGKKVTASFVESFSKDTTPRKLDDLLRMEYRTKLLNPKWAEAMVNQGSGGAFEVSQRMTALIGWGGTTDFTDDWVYDQAADTYALDPEMAEKLRKANPEAFRNIVGRMLEAHGRGFWQASEDKLQKLRELYELTDEELEGVTV